MDQDMPLAERDALLIRSALADSVSDPLQMTHSMIAFDPVMLAWLGMGEDEARARMEWFDREAPEAYQEAVCAQVDELDQGEDDRRRRRGF